MTLAHTQWPISSATSLAKYRGTLGVSLSMILTKCNQFIHRLNSGLFRISRTLMGASSSHEMSAAAVVQPRKDHTATLIFLHGLGDTGHGWAEGLQMLKFQHIKCVCPHAPIQPVSLNAGMRMPSWFDIQGLDPSSEEDKKGIKEASKILQDLMENERKNGIPSERIFIGGFSQGGAVALYTALSVNKPVGGVVALSTWLPLHSTLMADKASLHNTGVPVLQCHGTHDPMVRLTWGKKTNDFLQSLNPNTQFKTYDGMMHSSCPEEMQDLKVFLETHLGS